MRKNDYGFPTFPKIPNIVFGKSTHNAPLGIDNILTSQLHQIPFFSSWRCDFPFDAVKNAMERFRITTMNLDFIGKV